MDDNNPLVWVAVGALALWILLSYIKREAKAAVVQVERQQSMKGCA